MTEAATQHILLHVTAEGKVFAAGTENIVKAIVGEIELYQKIKTCINYNLMLMEIPKSWLTIFSPALPFVSLSLYLFMYSSCNIANRRFYLSSVSMVIESILIQDLVCADYNTYIFSNLNLSLKFIRFKQNIKATSNSRLCAAVCLYMR